MEQSHYTPNNHNLLERSKSLEEIENRLLNAPTDHEGHAHCVIELYDGKILYCGETGWMFYSGTHWQSDKDGAVVTQAVVETLRCRNKIARDVNRENLGKATQATRSNVGGTMELLKSKVSISNDQFDNFPDLLNCENGVLDLRTGELTSHNSDQRFTYCLNIPYYPDTDYSEWGQFLIEVIGDEEVIEYL